MDLDARLTVLGSLNMDISVTVPVLPGPGATVLGGAATYIETATKSHINLFI